MYVCIMCLIDFAPLRNDCGVAFNATSWSIEGSIMLNLKGVLCDMGKRCEVWEHQKTFVFVGLGVCACLKRTDWLDVQDMKRVSHCRALSGVVNAALSASYSILSEGTYVAAWCQSHDERWSILASVSTPVISGVCVFCEYCTWGTYSVTTPVPVYSV